MASKLKLYNKLHAIKSPLGPIFALLSCSFSLLKGPPFLLAYLPLLPFDKIRIYVSIFISPLS